MATVDQLSEVLRRAKIMCDAIWRGMGDTNVLSFQSTTDAVVALNTALNALPEYTPEGQSVITVGAKYNLRTNNYAAPFPGAVLTAQCSPPAAPYFMLDSYTTAVKSLVNIPLPGVSSVKMVVDATLKNMNIAIDSNGVIQSIAIGV